MLAMTQGRMDALSLELEPPSARRIPLAAKLAYTAFMAVLVPFYWTTYGPTNFLYFCDAALFLTLVGIWRESRLLVGMAAVGIVVPQLLWVIDFAGGFFGVHAIGMSEYMFRDSIPLFARGLSLFHGWLPFLVVWLVWRLGYERRSFTAWTLLAWGLMVASYLWLPEPGAAVDGNTPVNVNYVFGTSETEPQSWMHPHLYFALMTVGLPALLWWPAHRVFARWPGSAARGDARPEARDA